jgi:prephenate dehydrogenase
VGVYGLGRFGRFYAELLSRSFTVRAYSRNAGRLPPPGVSRVGEEELCRLPVLMLCVAISALPEVLRRVGPRLRPGALVMDTCSVKVLPAAWMAELLPAHARILATHPMFGPDSAQGGVKGLPLVLHPVRLEARALASWRSFFAGMGLAVRLMSPEQHDREAALTQGLTHFLGRVLAELRLEPSAVATLGYQKLLEIIEQTCNDSWQLFVDLQRYNPYTRQMRARLGDSLREVAARLDQAAAPGQPSPQEVSPEQTPPQQAPPERSPP